MGRVRVLLAGYAVIALIAGWPILSIIIAGTIAQMNGCRLHEGFVNPCIVGGVDVGATLYSMSILGFLAIATLPIGAVSFLVWTVAWLVFRRRRSAEKR